MENVSIRAITIGVGVLIAIATISAVFTYYGTAKETVRRIGSGNDIAGKYEKSIEEILLKTKVNGIEVKNILNYFYKKNGAEVYLYNIKLVDIGQGEEIDIGKYGQVLLTDTYFEQIIKYLLPNTEFEIDTDVSDNLTKIIIEQK